MPVESTKKILLVALGICLVCSVLVATAVVGLKGRQENNKQLDKLKNILIAADLYTNDAEVKQIFNAKVRAQLVNLETGELVAETKAAPELAPARFVPKVRDARNPEYSSALSVEKDIAHILRRPNFMVIYQVIENGQVASTILPIYGKGLWSTLYGFIAFDSDLQTVRGLIFYEHGETPGLGGEVDNPLWRRGWNDKKALSPDGKVLLEVLKGHADPANPRAQSQVDGLSGATLTTRGIDNMVKFWLGENGYGRILPALRETSRHE
ncbi:MAG: Na(+)-translocating NADH-quinone reductase subunit C [Candidatus Neomarinimicrobiota bacterium]